MDLESPDVEKDFPGLYASEGGYHSNESDFSEDGGRKELLIGKKKDKKKDKDKGYAALEGESSGVEDALQDTKSPSKSKRTKPFKFTSSKKEKKEKKEKEKEVKELEKKEKKDSKKQKSKDKKKSKHKDELNDELPIFGVPLNVAVERQPCKDESQIPLIVRDCIDYIEETGLNLEGIYRSNVVKTKILPLKQKYDRREAINLHDCDPHVVAALLKVYLRDLPEPLINAKAMNVWEEASSGGGKADELRSLFGQLPTCNRHLLCALFTHFQHAVQKEKQNKLSVKEVVLMLGPTLQLNSKVLHAFFGHFDALFGDPRLVRHGLPPVDSSTGMTLPQTAENLTMELGRHELLLEELHTKMRRGSGSAQLDEQLWETQRIVTQLKRRLRQVQRVEMSKCRSESATDDELKLELAVKTEPELPEQEEKAEKEDVEKEATPKEEQPQEVVSENKEKEDEEKKEKTRRPSYVTVVNINNNGMSQPPDPRDEAELLKMKDELALLLAEECEVLKQQARLKANILKERAEVQFLKQEIAARTRDNQVEEESKLPIAIDPKEEEEIAQLEAENRKLEAWNAELLERITAEQLACARLQAHIQLVQVKQELGCP